MATNTKVISPGSTIGILGAGQLGKMSLIAAHQLGYRTAVWAPEGDIPAMEMATHRIVAPFNDAQAFDEMCRVADVITTEWENIPVELLQKLEARGKLVRPSSKILSIAQSRSTEKMFAFDNNIDPTPWMYIPSHSDVLDKRYQVDVLLPGILKTDRNGYDGKGQFAVQTWEDVLSHIDLLKQPCVLEKKIPLDCEMSVLVARNASGEVKVSDVVHNTHINGILSVS